MKEYIAKAVDGKDLTQEEAKKAMEIMLSGEATQAQIAAFLTAMRMKGETLEELIGLASVLRDKAETITPKSENYVDLVGTGGDCTYTFNISTTSAFVVAAAGLPVAKHGNRSISSKSGAGDVLEALGVNIMAEPALVQKCVDETGIGFMFAQLFNKSMKYVGQVRKELGIRTVFNILRVSWLLCVMLKNTFCFPRDCLSLSPDIHDKLSPGSAFHWKTSADGTPHNICSIRNPRNILPSAACCNSCPPSSDTSAHPSPPYPGEY